MTRMVTSPPAVGMRALLFAWVLPLACACATTDRVEPGGGELEAILADAYGASGAAFSEDGGLLAVATHNKVWVAEVASRKVIQTLNRHLGAQFGNKDSLIFLDRQTLGVGTQGGVLVWDLASDVVTDRIRLINTFHAPRAMAWSGATRTLAFSTGTTSEPVNLVHITADNHFGPVRGLPGFEGIPADLLFSPDGRYLAATGDGNGVFVRDVETGALVGELPTRGEATQLEPFAGGRLLVAGDDVAFWSFTNEPRDMPDVANPDLEGQISSQVAVRVAGTIAFGVLGILMAPIEALAGGGDATANAFMAATEIAGTPVKTARQGGCGRTTTVSPDGKLLVDVYPGITREVINVYHLDQDLRSHALNPRGKYTCTAKFSPDGKTLLLATDKTVRLYNTRSWRSQDLELD